MRQQHGWRILALAVCVLALAAGGLRADDAAQPAGGAPLDRKALDKNIYESLRDVINQGALIYNPPTSDWNGCHRLYEGALMATRSLLGHRAELQKAIDAGLTKARQNPELRQRAFDLRAVIDRIRDEVNPNPKPATLWTRLGGEANVKKVIDDFVTKAAENPKVDFFRGGKVKNVDVPMLKKLLVEFVSSATGGPYPYTGRSMKAVHKGMGITDAQFDASVADLKEALEKNGAKPADVKAVLAAVEGTRKDIVEKKSDGPKETTLWDRLGGEKNVNKVVADFVGRAATNPKVDFFRGGKVKDVDVPKLKKLLVEFISSASGGPLKYTGKSMKEVHKGMGITDAQFDASAADLKKALEDNGAKEPDIKAVLAAVEKTRKDIVEKKSEPPKETTLWDRLGGEANVKKVVDDFVAAASKNQKVDFFRSGKSPLDEQGVARLKKLLVEFVSKETGGPLKYTGKSMKEVHKGMGITDAQFDASVVDLKNALEKNGAKEPDIKAVLDAVEKTRKDIVEKK
jgi:truncated hemoglobin YjbI